MAYHGCPPGWKPDYVEAEREGGKSVLVQVQEEQSRYAAEQAKEAPAVEVAVEPSASVSEMVAEPERKVHRPR